MRSNWIKFLPLLALGLLSGCSVKLGSSTVTPKLTTANSKLPSTGAIAYPVLEGTAHTIYEISPNGNGKRVLTKSAFGPTFAWSPDGDKIAFFDASSIGRESRVKILATNTLEPSIVRTYRLNGITANEIAWAPNGKKIYVSGLAPNSSGSGYALGSAIFSIDSASGSVKRVTSVDNEDEQDPRPSASGKQIAFQLRQQFSQEQLAAASSDPATQAAKLKQMTIPDSIAVMNSDGSGKRALTGNKRSANSPKWLPNGRIAYSVFGDATDPEHSKAQIFSVSPSGTGKPSKVNFPPSIAFSYAPDNEWVVYSDSVDGNSELFIANTQGKNKTRLTKDAEDESWPQWRP